MDEADVCSDLWEPNPDANTLGRTPLPTTTPSNKTQPRASPVPTNACRVSSGLLEGIPSTRITLLLCLLPIQPFVSCHED